MQKEFKSGTYRTNQAASEGQIEGHLQVVQSEGSDKRGATMSQEYYMERIQTCRKKNVNRKVRNRL